MKCCQVVGALSFASAWSSLYAASCGSEKGRSSSVSAMMQTQCDPLTFGHGSVVFYPCRTESLRVGGHA